MVAISMEADIKAATRWLDKKARKQIPFATSLALNSTAAHVQKIDKATMQRDLDNPTPGTVKAVRVYRSTKRRLQAKVFILPMVARFLNYQIQGGTRPPRGRTEAVPVNVRLNKYGNVIGRRQGKIGKLLARPDTFSGTVKGVAGIWQRQKKGKGRWLKLLFAYESRTRYKRRWKFYDISERAARRAWPSQFRKALRRALASG